MRSRSTPWVCKSLALVEDAHDQPDELLHLSAVVKRQHFAKLHSCAATAALYTAHTTQSATPQAALHQPQEGTAR